MPLTPGTRLGPYEILAPLGSGGMGEVYRARDTRLGREVAVKVLPEHLSSNVELRARFEREAKNISSLNHPHICSLFDVGRAGEIDYLVMELIEGETLASRLARGALPASDLLRIGAQIAAALDRAHRAGVVHRDLKPGNVMLAKSGAKLMDFGLARAMGPAGPISAVDPTIAQSPTLAAPLTSEGAIVGTMQYMAPEQLEGREADARSDLWAVGCVLYEMATGQRPFVAPSQASLIAAIMTGEPRPIAVLLPVTPPGLERLIQQCLQKDPEDRLQSARDLAFTLDLIAAGELKTTTVADSTASAPRRAALWRLGIVAALIAAGAFVAGRLTVPPPTVGSIRVSTLSQGTRDFEPAVSPDGRLIAFSAVRQNGQGLWLMDMVTRSEIKLTDDADHLPRFTADSGSIVFTRTKRGRQSLWRIPALGGTPRLLLENAADADLSPEGDRVAFLSGSTDSSGAVARLMLAHSDGTAAHELWSRTTGLMSSPRWSPDGNRIAIATTSTQNTFTAVVVIDVSDGASHNYPAPSGSVLSNAVWDGTGDGLIVAEGVGVTAVQRGSSGRLFRLDADSGEYRPLGWLENFPSLIDLLPDGRLVMSSLVARQNLREVALGAHSLVDGRWLTSGLCIDRQPVYSPDGTAVMFSSNRGGTLDLWEVSVASGEMHRVTDDPEDDWDPEYAPDGQSIYWCSSRSGAFEIWTARRDGSAARQLSFDGLDAENPSVTPDNSAVFYSSANADKSGVWRIPVQGGGGELLLRGSTLIPDLSPNGQQLSVITGIGTLETRLSVFDLAQVVELPHAVPLQVQPGTIQFGRARFMPDGMAVTYLHAGEDGQPILLRRPLSSWQGGIGTTDTLFARGSETIESFDFSPDGRRAIVSVVDWLSGLTIAEGVHDIVPPKRR